MAAMYAPDALEPHRWVPGDGFQLRAASAPYRILRRQRFDFLPPGETLIFEGCRALYRPPGAQEWTWDGALRIWVQVNFGPDSSLLRRGARLLCAADTPAAEPTHPAAEKAPENVAIMGAYNILPEILDRLTRPDFEIVVLDLRGGRSLPEILEEGWPQGAVPSPFSAAGAIEIVRRLIELNRLCFQAGHGLAMLHPDQVMVDENLNLRLRGLPWLAPVDAAGHFPPAWRTALAARAEGELIQAPDDREYPPDSRLCWRWLAAFVDYLVTGRFVPASVPLARRLEALYAPGLPREPEPWEVGLITRLWAEDRTDLPAVAAGLLTAVQGVRSRLTAANARPFCFSVKTLLNEKLQENSWDEVVRLATWTTQPLPAVFSAAQAAAAESEASATDPLLPPSPSLQPLTESTQYKDLNGLLDRIAKMAAALDRAANLARQTPNAVGRVGATTPAAGPAAGRAGFRPSRLTDVAPLPPPVAPLPPPTGGGGTPRRTTVMVNAYGVPITSPAGLQSAEPAQPRWQSPFKALAFDLIALPPTPAYAARLAQWLEPLRTYFTADWIDPPLSAAEAATLQLHSPALWAAIPALLTAVRQAAVADLTAVAADCARNGVRELPRVDRALRTVLRQTLPTAGEATAVDGTSPLRGAQPDWLPPVEAAVGAIEASGKLDPALLARLVYDATADRPEARAGARIGALCRLEAGLRAAQAAMAGVDSLPALAAIRAALDEWPQYSVLQERWRQALSACVLPAVAGLETLAALSADAFPAAVDALPPATVAGLTGLLAGPAASNARWLGEWQPRIAMALGGLIGRLTVRGGPVAQRWRWLENLGGALQSYDRVGIAEWREHLALTRQRRLDLRAALRAARAQAAWGKVLALWNSGETSLSDDGAPALPAAEAPADGVVPAPIADGADLGRLALALWLEQATQAIARMPAPRDPNELAMIIDRLLTPLKPALTLLATPPAHVTVAARDLAETMAAIEEDLFDHMAAQVAGSADFGLWRAAWAQAGWKPRSTRWPAVLAGADGTVGGVGIRWAQWLAARKALAAGQLDAAQAALAGSDGAGIARFQGLVPAATLNAILAAFAEQWDRRQAAQAQAVAVGDLDAAIAHVAQALTQLQALTQAPHPQLTAVEQELATRRRKRDAARLRVDHRRAAFDQALAAGHLATAVQEFGAVESDWTATERAEADRQALRRDGLTRLRAALQARIAEAAKIVAPAAAASTAAVSSDATASALAALQAAAAGLEADPVDIWPVSLAPAPGDSAPLAPTDLRPAIEARLGTLFDRLLARQSYARFGTALQSGLSAGALPPDAPFWTALLRAAAAEPASLETLRTLPVGALGPEEWRRWLEAASGVFEGRAADELTAVRERVAIRCRELQADTDRLTSTLAGAGAGAGPLAQATALREFIGRWRNGAVVETRRESLAAVESAAQAAFDAALIPPTVPWLWRPFVYRARLKAAREAAAVVGMQDEHREAEQIALQGIGIRLAVAGALALAIGAALWIWL